MGGSRWLSLRSALFAAMAAELACGRPPVQDEGSESSAGSAESQASEASSVSSEDGESQDSGTVTVSTGAETASEVTTTEATSDDATTEDASTEDATTEDVSTEDATTEDATTEDATTEDATTEDATTAGDGDGDGDELDCIEDPDPCPFEGALECNALAPDVVWECQDQPGGGALWCPATVCEFTNCSDQCGHGFAFCDDDFFFCADNCYDTASMPDDDCFLTVDSLDFGSGTSFVRIDGEVIEELPTNTCDGQSGYIFPDLTVPEIEFCGDACTAYLESQSVETQYSCFVFDGRPIIIDGELHCAGVERRADWCATHGESLNDRRRANRYLQVALAEHASVAAFARFTLQLMAVGAPPRFLEDAQRAMGDEIRHAKMAFALASSFAGRELGPSELVEATAPIDTSLDAVALATFFEGCVGETLAAARAARLADSLPAGPEQTFWAQVAEDETRHAALAWRFLAWSWSRLSGSARRRITSAAQSPGSLHACAPERRTADVDLWAVERDLELVRESFDALVSPLLTQLAA